MKTIIGTYITVRRNDLEELNGSTFRNLETAKKEAESKAGLANTDYAVIKIQGIMLAFVKTEFIETEKEKEETSGTHSPTN